MAWQGRADAILVLLDELERELQETAPQSREWVKLDAEAAILRRLHAELIGHGEGLDPPPEVRPLPSG
jgi:hypothetical protein